MSAAEDDLVIEALARAEADLREANRQLVDLVADLAFENRLLRLIGHCKFRVGQIRLDDPILLGTPKDQRPRAKGAT
jgi:hypothetical protein